MEIKTTHAYINEDKLLVEILKREDFPLGRHIEDKRGYMDSLCEYMATGRRGQIDTVKILTLLLRWANIVKERRTSNIKNDLKEKKGSKF